MTRHGQVKIVYVTWFTFPFADFFVACRLKSRLNEQAPGNGELDSFFPPFDISTTVLDCRITQVYRSIATSQVESSPYVTSAGLLVYLLLT